MTHYEILGVKRTASADEIKSAYKKLVKKYHPDVYVGDKAFAEKKIKEINEAYDVLSNPDLKTEYDNSITPKATYEPTDYSSYTTPKYNYTSSNSSYRTTTSKRNAEVRDSKYSYENYRRTYNSTNYGSYDYQKRYTDYHRSKTPNSDYVANDNVKSYSEKILDTFFDFSNVKKIYILIFILILFLMFFIVNTVQILSIFKIDDPQATSSQSSSSKIDSKIKNNHSTHNKEDDYYQNKTSKNTNPYLEPDPDNSSSSTPNSDNSYLTLEEFDINDIFSDDEIMEAYLEYGTSNFSSFEEFKETLRVTYYKAYILPLLRSR